MRNQPEYLDLTIHDFEDIKGKLISLHGRDYMLYQQLGAGGEGTVFALMNMKSQVMTLAGKIYHYLKGAPEYEETIENISRVMFFLGAEAAGFEPRHIAPEALQEVAGGLIGVQQCLTTVDAEMGFYDLVNESARLLNAREFAETVAVCDRILQQNPFSIYALCNKASALAGLSKVYDAAKLMMQAVEVEPNDPRLSRWLARYFCDLGRIEAALRILRHSLARWKWDGWTWKMLAHIAAECDLTDEFAEEIAYGLAALPERLSELRAELTASAGRQTRYKTVLAKALEAQKHRDWDAALATHLDARAISRNNRLAVLNAQVCRYHLQQWDGIAETASEAFHQAAGPGPQQSAAAAIAIVALVRSGDFDQAKALALYLANDANNPFDLPRIPLVVAAEAIVEAVPLASIVAAIEAIAATPDLPANEVRSLQSLLDGYAELDRLTNTGN